MFGDTQSTAGGKRGAIGSEEVCKKESKVELSEVIGQERHMVMGEPASVSPRVCLLVPSSEEIHQSRVALADTPATSHDVKQLLEAQAEASGEQVIVDPGL